MQAIYDFLSDLSFRGIKLSLDGDKLNCFSQPGAMSPAISRQILALRPQIIALLSQNMDTASTQMPLTRFPLSAGQAGLYALERLSPGLSTFNVPMCFTSTATIDSNHLSHAWSLVQKYYPVLTARFIEENGHIWQELDSTLINELSVVILENKNDSELREVLQNSLLKSFNLNEGPLTRAHLFIRPDCDATLFITAHHIVVDGISTVLMMRSLFACYEALVSGRQPPAMPTGEGYSAFVEWEAAMLASPEGLRHREYWRCALANCSSEITFPDRADRKAKVETGQHTATETLPSAIAARVIELSRCENVPPSAIFLAAYRLLLHRVTGQEDIVVTMPVMGRDGGRFRNDVGYFVNLVPLRGIYTPNAGFIESAKIEMRTMSDALFHSAYPFSRIVSDLSDAQRGGRGGNPFRTLYAFQNVLQLGAVTGDEHRNLPITMRTEFAQPTIGDFELEVFEQGENYTLNLKYQASVVATETAHRMIASLVALLGSVTSDPSHPVQDYPLLDAEHRATVLEAFNDTATSYEDSDALIHELIEAQADRMPDATAIVFGEDTLTRRELDDRANALAHYLISLGCRPDERVAIVMERSLELAVCLVAVLKAGGAYVPVDPDYPPDRIAYMLENSAPIAVLTQEHLRSILPPQTVPVIAVDTETDTITAAGLRVGIGRPVVADLTQHNLCYVIYTSGSTGQPKGAMNEHRAVVNRLLWMQEHYKLAATDRVLQKTPYSFDVSVWEFFWPLFTDAVLVIAPPKLHKDPYALTALVEREGISVLHFVPSMLRVFLDVLASGCCSGIRQIICSGEELSTSLANRCRTDLPKTALGNLYGPTEAAIDVTFWDCVEPGEDVRTPIGRPIANTRIYVLDAQLRPVPVGVTGDIFIGGVAVGRGYLNRSELTADRFIADPFVVAGRMYKTGDLGRWMADGTIDYLGRSDFQVKIRGQRIELGEIEERLGRCVGVREVVVTAREDSPGDQRLVAYLTIADSASVDIGEFRGQLGRSLPDYMVPTAYVILDSMPLSANGKLDRKMLPAPDVAAYGSTAYEPPATPEEAMLASIWAELLGIEQIGREDDFFRLGGHSLLIMRLEAQLRDRANVAMPLRSMFETTILREQAEVLATLIGMRNDDAIDQLLPQEREALSVPSSAQAHLWILDQLNPDASLAYNMASALRLTGRLDESALRRALDEVVMRHEVLRTRFVIIAGQPMQECRADISQFPLRTLDLSQMSLAEQELEVLQARSADLRERFDFAKGPMIRGTLIRLAPEDHILLFSQHHIASDGWSNGVLVHELTTFYTAFSQGRDHALAPLSVQYADYAIWQKKWLLGAEMKRQLCFWTEHLAGAPQLLTMPFDRPRPDEQDFKGASVQLNLSSELVEGLRRFSQRNGATLFMTLLAAWAVTIYRVGGQGDLVIGTAVANRRFAAVEPLIGFFVNTLAVRVRPNTVDTIDALMAQVKATMLDVYANQDLPFEHVVNTVQKGRSLGHSPLFQTMVTLNNTSMPTNAAMHGLHVDLLEHVQRTAQFEINLGMAENEHGLRGEIDYFTALFDHGTVERIARHLEMVLAAMASGEQDPIGLEFASGNKLAPADQNDEIVRDLKMIHVQFEDHAARTPDAEAIRWNGVSISYGDLNTRANQLAHRLREFCVGAGERVIVCLQRSPDTFAATLGVLKAGGAYVPVDATYPIERLKHIVEDCTPKVVIVDHSTRAALTAASGRSLDVFDLEDDTRLLKMPGCNPEPIPSLTDVNLAYIIYTSGTTGIPKGVMVEHRNIAAMAASWRELYNLHADMRHLQMASYTFDVCTGDICRAFTNGACLVLCPREALVDGTMLGDLMLREQIAMGDFVPAVLRQLLDHLETTGVSLPDLRIVACGADVWPLADAIRLQRLVNPSVRQFNSYGVTEAAVDSVCFETSGVDLSALSTLPIGRAMPHARLYVLDEQGRHAPEGEGGEIYIGGLGVARGYLNLPELTAERFLVDPFSDKSSARMYRTGDLGRRLADDNVEYLGRNDFQVKIRGYRVELAEVESALLRCPGIREAVAVAQNDGSGGNRLAVYYTVAKDIVTSPDALREALKVKLPEMMVPAFYVLLEALPLTANGKLDRTKLPEPTEDDTAAVSYEPPEGDIEQALARIWAETLGVERVGRRDDFFRLGGHSLLAVQLMTRIKRRLGRSLPVAALFRHSDIASLAAALATDFTQINTILMPIQENGDDRPLFAVPGAGGSMLPFNWLSKAINDRRRDAGVGPLPFYGLQMLGLDEKTPATTSVEETAALNIAAIRLVQPAGPYRLVGFSYGGAVVYEMARQLREEHGERISVLLLLDSFAPTAMNSDVTWNEIMLISELRNTIALMFPGVALDLDPTELLALDFAERGQRVSKLLEEQGVEVDAVDLSGFFRIYQANLKCYHAYRPGPLASDVPMALLRVESDDNVPEDYGWGEILGRAPTVRRVGGTHFSMLDLEHITGLSSVLGEVTDLIGEIEQGDAETQAAIAIQPISS